MLIGSVQGRISFPWIMTDECRRIEQDSIASILNRECQVEPVEFRVSLVQELRDFDRAEEGRPPSAVALGNRVDLTSFSFSRPHQSSSQLTVKPEAAGVLIRLFLFHPRNNGRATYDAHFGIFHRSKKLAKPVLLHDGVVV